MGERREQHRYSTTAPQRPALAIAGLWKQMCGRARGAPSRVQRRPSILRPPRRGLRGGFAADVPANAAALIPRRGARAALAELGGGEWYDSRMISTLSMVSSAAMCRRPSAICTISPCVVRYAIQYGNTETGIETPAMSHGVACSRAQGPIGAPSAQYSHRRRRHSSGCVHRARRAPRSPPPPTAQHRHPLLAAVAPSACQPPRSPPVRMSMLCWLHHNIRTSVTSSEWIPSHCCGPARAGVGRVRRSRRLAALRVLLNSQYRFVVVATLRRGWIRSESWRLVAPRLASDALAARPDVCYLLRRGCARGGRRLRRHAGPRPDRTPGRLQRCIRGRRQAGVSNHRRRGRRQCGFGNPSRMNRAFERELGITPHAYRQLHTAS